MKPLSLTVIMYSTDYNLSVSRTQASLGAPRSRVGIAHMGFDAPSWQYLMY